MMMKVTGRILFGALAVILLTACAPSADKLNQLRLNMTRDEVLAAIGPPGSTSETAGVLYLRYRLSSDAITHEEYYVRLIDGKVDAYGRLGDFGLGY
jgi:hypothetical protein